MIDEPSISDGVAFVSRVLAAIDFDDKPLFAAHKVNDIRTDRLLADEFKVADSPRDRRYFQSLRSAKVEFFAQASGEQR